MRLLRDREYFPALIREIKKAKKEITARIFLIDPSGGSKDPVLEILKALQAANKKSVRVNLLTDGIFLAKPSGKRLRETTGKLGLPLKWDAKSTVLHEKTVLIDGQILFLGSHNWTRASLLENRELSLKLPAKTPRISGASLSVRQNLPAKFPLVSVLDALAFSKQTIDDIDRAQKEIRIATFDIDESPDPFQFGTRLTQALIRAASRKVKVTILFDAFQMRIPETGEILYQYRGMKKAVELRQGGVEVYYDRTASMFHAKTVVIDRKICYVGSQNLEMRKDVEALEATVRMVSSEHAGHVSAYLDGVLKNAVRYFYGPAELSGMPVPVSFIRKGGPLNRLYTNAGGKGFRLYLSLLKTAWDKNAASFPSPVPGTLRHERRRLVRDYKLISFQSKHLLSHHERGPGIITVLHPQTPKPFSFPTRDVFILPHAFFEYGWDKRLRVRDIFTLMIHLEGGQNSGQSPYWSMKNTEIARINGMDYSSLSHATIALERENLIEVIRDPKITVKNVVKKPNRYRINSLWNPLEQVLIKKKMLEELSMKEARLKETGIFAKRLNQDEDLEVIRKFLLLIDRYGAHEVEKAVRLTTRFKHHFALRTVHHSAAILRNWSVGIYK